MKIKFRKYCNRVDNLDESAQRIVWLVEDRGVGAYFWREEIDDIVKWIRDYIKLHNDEVVDVEIPFYLTKKISFIRNLKIYVSSERKENNFGCGLSGSSDERGIYFNKKNNDFSNVKIEIFCTHDMDGNLKTRTFLNSFYHEINHMFECWKDLCTNKTPNSFNRHSAISTIKTGDDFIDEIIYRLFSETEFNALIAGVYGDLEGLKSTRENFRHDIKRTQAYLIYQNIQKNYKSYIDEMSDEFASNLRGKLMRHGVYLNPRVSFKSSLQGKVEMRLEKLINQIGKVASLYYDTIERKNINENELKITII